MEQSLVITVVLVIVGVIFGYFLGRLANASNNARVKDLESQLKQATHSQQESVTTVNQALSQIKELAVNMATTYHLLEVTKASLEGNENKESKEFLLQIKNGRATLLDDKTHSSSVQEADLEQVKNAYEQSEQTEQNEKAQEQQAETQEQEKATKETTKEAQETKEQETSAK